VHAHRALGEHRLALLDRAMISRCWSRATASTIAGRSCPSSAAEAPPSTMRSARMRRGCRGFGDRLVKADVGLALDEVVVGPGGGVLDDAPQLAIFSALACSAARPASGTSSSRRTSVSSDSDVVALASMAPTASLTVRAGLGRGCAPRTRRRRAARGPQQVRGTSKRTPRGRPAADAERSGSSASVPTRSPRQPRAAIACCSSCDTRSLDGLRARRGGKIDLLGLNLGILARTSGRAQNSCTAPHRGPSTGEFGKRSLFRYALTWYVARSSIRPWAPEGRIIERGGGELMSEKRRRIRAV